MSLKLSTRTRYLGAVAAAALMVGAASGSAHASPVVFTFNPGAVGLAGGSPFTGDTLNVKDYSRVQLGATTGTNTAFTESGFLQLNNVSLAGNTFDPAGNRSTYSIYLSFSGTGTQTAASFATSSSGTFNTLNYTLVGANGASVFSVAGGTPTVTNTGSTVDIATGSLIAGGTSLTVVGSGISPGASVSETVNKLLPAFFVDPANMQLTLAGAFNNDTNIVTVTDGGKAFLLNGGGGDITFTGTPVPEPISLALVGTGLIGLGLIRRRRA